MFTGWKDEITKVVEKKYLGDIISWDGKNKKEYQRQDKKYHRKWEQEY